jgi:hypothetical protein
VHTTLTFFNTAVGGRRQCARRPANPSLSSLWAGRLLSAHVHQIANRKLPLIMAHMVNNCGTNCP